MKVDVAQIQAMYRRWPDDVRIVLLHGQDAAASRDHADQIARQFADPANPMAVETLTGGVVGSDPQALVAAAGAMSMFGDRTLVRVDGLDDDSLPAITAIAEGPPGNPVIAVAGALKKGSKLQAYAEKSSAIASLVSYEPGLRDAQRLANEIGNPLGLRVGRDAAVALFEAAGGDRTIMRREIEKLGLYLDSDGDRPKSLEIADVLAVGVGVGDSDQFALGGAVAGGRMAIAADLLARLPTGMGIVALRAVERRLTMLMGLRGVVDGGASPQTAVDGARPPIFWKEKEAVAAELTLWTTPALVRGLADILAAERAIKSSGSLGDMLAEATLLTLARRAAARRNRG
jgi:DNA polymerase-3 subunit delta